jgi:hypothetical protein
MFGFAPARSSKLRRLPDRRRARPSAAPSCRLGSTALTSLAGGLFQSTLRVASPLPALTASISRTSAPPALSVATKADHGEAPRSTTDDCHENDRKTLKIVQALISWWPRGGLRVIELSTS